MQTPGFNAGSAHPPRIVTQSHGEEPKIMGEHEDTAQLDTRTPYPPLGITLPPSLQRIPEQHRSQVIQAGMEVAQKNDVALDAAIDMVVNALLTNTDGGPAHPSVQGPNRSQRRAPKAQATDTLASHRRKVLGNKRFTPPSR
jgi:hypothetical protein